MSDRTGNIYEVVNDKDSDADIGSILIMRRDDGSSIPFFDCIKGSLSCSAIGMQCLKQIWPNPEPVETIELMGKTYSKTEIEGALKGILPVK